MSNPTTPPASWPHRSFRRALGIAASFALLSAAASAQTAPNVYINEINYDTPGVDDITSDERIEFVEIVAPAGFDTAGWALLVYDGADGSVVERRDFPEDNPGDTVFPDQENGYGVLALRIAQPDGVGGIALVDDQERVIQFLSYEGVFTGTEGPANGLESTLLPVTDPDQAAGESDISLQLVGTGTEYSDFRWTSDRAPTPNSFNSGQTIGDDDTPVAAEGGVADGASLALYPNPSAGRVSIDLVVAAPSTARVSVYDALGREVAVLHDGPVSGQTRVPVEAGRLVSGTYMVRAVTPDFVLTQALSVVR